MAGSAASVVRKLREQVGRFGAGSHEAQPLLKVPQPIQTVPPAGDQTFKHMSLWGTVHIRAAGHFNLFCHQTAAVSWVGWTGSTWWPERPPPYLCARHCLASGSMKSPDFPRSACILSLFPCPFFHSPFVYHCHPHLYFLLKFYVSQ